MSRKTTAEPEFIEHRHAVFVSVGYLIALAGVPMLFVAEVSGWTEFYSLAPRAVTIAIAFWMVACVREFLTPADWMPPEPASRLGRAIVLSLLVNIAVSLAMLHYLSAPRAQFP